MKTYYKKIVALLTCTLFVSCMGGSGPMTDLEDYPEIRNGIKPEKFVAHFPKAIPPNKNAYFFYQPGELQADTDFQLLVEFASQELFDQEKQRLISNADTMGTYSYLNDTANININVFVQTEKNVDIEDFPLIVLFNLKEVSVKSHNHDGAAINEKTKTILYWFKDV